MQMRQKDLQNTMTDEYNRIITEGLPLNVRDRVARQEAIVRNYGLQTQMEADMAAVRGALPRSVEFIRNKDQAKEYALAKATAEMAGEEFDTYAEQELNRLGITDPETAQVVLKTIQDDYLRAHNLYGISTDFLGTTLEKMGEGRKLLLDKLSNAQLKGKSADRTDKALKVFYKTPTPENLYDLWNAKKSEFDGTKFGDGATAAEWLRTDVFTNVEMFPQRIWEQVLEFPIMQADGTPHPKLKWKDQLAPYMPEILNKRASNSKAIATRQDHLMDYNWYKTKNETKEWLVDKWDRRHETLETIEKAMLTEGYDPTDVQNFLSPYRESSIQGIRESVLDDEFQDLADNGMLSMEDMGRPGVTGTLIKKI